LVVVVDRSASWRTKLRNVLRTEDLDNIAKARLHDAQVLFDAGRYDGAVYLCGYAVELALKTRICKTLSWAGYPSTKAEFQNLQSLKTHSLDVLLSLSGVEAKVKTSCLAEWSAVAAWEPEVRYKPVGSATPGDAKLMIESAKILLGVL